MNTDRKPDEQGRAVGEESRRPERGKYLALGKP
jgi:hypothetical protein